MVGTGLNIYLKQGCLAGSSKETIEEANTIAGGSLPHLNIKMRHKCALLCILLETQLETRVFLKFS